MTSASDSTAKPGKGKRDLLFAAGLLGVLLLVLFHRSFIPEETLFSNDAPLGALRAYADVAPSFFTGSWHTLNWIGTETPSALPNLTYGMYLLWGPVAHSKYFVPVALFLLGTGTWLFLRRLGLGLFACALGAIAALLNTDPFSYACWGLPSLTLCMAATFFALAALVRSPTRPEWMRAVLGGLALGMAIMEGYDNGAIFSLYIAAYVLFQEWVHAEVPSQSLVKGSLRVLVVAVCAGLIAAHALSTLIGTQIKGIVGAQQDATTKEQRWDEATMWSLPKVETLRLVIPGLFGYRMDTPEGGNYWGAVGQAPGVPQSRHSGSGVYAGVLVLLVAAFALAQAARKKDSPFSAKEKKLIWFWAVAALVSLLLAFGRHAPFYQFFYQLPYFSTIRNPIKFIHPFTIAVVTLFAFGLEALSRRYFTRRTTKTSSVSEQVQLWWSAGPSWEKRWTHATLGLFAAAVLGWLLYYSSRTELLAYLQLSGFPGELGASMLRFSFGEVGWFVLFLGLGVGCLVLILSGSLSGPRSRWAAGLLGLLLVTDFARANSPWIVYYNYREKYASNPVLDELRERPFDHRVAARLFPLSSNYLVTEQALPLFKGIAEEWLQHQYQYYRVQSLDIVQMPRIPELDMAFLKAMGPSKGGGLLSIGRLWQLTNTRYVVGMAGFLDQLNQQIDPTNQSFRLHTAFNLDLRSSGSAGSGTRIEDFTAVVKPDGPFAVFEFGAALPRAQLFPEWEVMTNDTVALQRLANPAFDPRQTVLLTEQPVNAAPRGGAKPAAGSVTFTLYEPKHVRMRTEAEAATVLLLNDKYDPNWKVSVDGRSEALLRCNFIMRGVSLAPGHHDVEFRFDPPHGTLYVSLAAIGVGMLLCAFLAFGPKQAAGEAFRDPAPEPNLKAQS